VDMTGRRQTYGSMLDLGWWFFKTQAINGN
jgi:hypothetical protein